MKLNIKSIKAKKEYEKPVEYWMSYSDLMAGLLMGFMLLISVVILLYRTEIQTQLHELTIKNEKLKELDKVSNEAIKNLNKSIEEQKKTREKLSSKELTLKDRDEELRKLTEKEKETIEKLHKLIKYQTQMLLENEEQKKKLTELEKVQTDMVSKLDSKQKEIDRIIGIKQRIIENLLGKFKDTGLNLSIDAQSGAIKFAEGILFEYNKAELTEAGKKQMLQFIPHYVETLFGDAGLKKYISQIIIEGHTDDKGSYMYNLELSQKRAFAVAAFIQSEEMPDFKYKKEFTDLLTANGRSFNQPVYIEKGIVDKEKSRRVEFKFRMKEMEKVNEIKRIIEKE
jgi:chemotaxis protein MotB